MVGSPWCSKWSRWIGDRGAYSWTLSSISSLDSTLFFFMRWITSVLLKLLSNYWMVEFYSRMGGNSVGWGSWATMVSACSFAGCLVLCAPFFTLLLVQGGVGGGGACGVGFTFCPWGAVVSSQGGTTLRFLNIKPSSPSLVSLSSLKCSTVGDGCCFVGVALHDTWVIALVSLGEIKEGGGHWGVGAALDKDIPIFFSLLFSWVVFASASTSWSSSTNFHTASNWCNALKFH